MLKSFFRQVNNYFEFGFFAIFRVIGLYFIPLFIVDNKLFFSKEGIITAILLNFLCSLLIMFNAYVDRDIDRIVHPDRLIPSGKVSLKDARIFILITIVLSVGTLFFLKNLFITIISVTLLLYYLTVCMLKHTSVKRFSLFGIVYGLAAPIFTGAFFYLVGYEIIGRHDRILFLFSLVFCLLDIGHDLYGYILDKEGDDYAKIKTILKTFGQNKTVIGAILCDLLVLLVMFYYISQSSVYIFWVFGIFTLIFGSMLFVAGYNFYTTQNRKKAYVARKWHNIMTFGLGILCISKVKPESISLPIALILLVVFLFSSWKAYKKEGKLYE